MKKETLSHIPSTGRIGEGVMVASTILVGAMTKSISETNPEQKGFLLLPLALALFEMRLLWLAAQERKQNLPQVTQHRSGDEQTSK
jgi:hypothetical protein